MNTNQTTSSAAFADLRKLSGMAYHGGKPAEHWIALVGVDPRKHSEIEVSKGGCCYWTKRAEAKCRAHWNAVQYNFAMLTESTFRPQ